MKNNIVIAILISILPHISYTDDATTFHRYLWANYNHFSGNVTCAQDWYKKIFSTNCSLYTYKGYLHFLANTKQFKRIVELLPSLDKKFEKDQEVQLLFVLALEENKHIAAADSRIIALSDVFKTNAEIAFKATQTYLRKKDLASALITINSFLNNTPRKPNNFVFYFFKSQIHMQLNDHNQALESVNKCLEMHPRFDQGWLLLATLHEQKGQIQDALAGYRTVLEITGHNTNIERHMYILMARLKRDEANKTIINFNRSYSENAQLLFEQKKYSQALTNIDKYLEQKNDNSIIPAQLLKIEILTAMNNFDALTKTICVWFNNDPHNCLWPKTVHLLSHKNVSQPYIISLLRTLADNHPESVWPHLYCADLYIRGDDTSNALHSLNQALSLTTDNALRTKIFHQLGLLHYEKQDFKSMLSSLENAYAIDPNLAQLNNSLAYYWAVEGNDLAKAQTLISNALAHEKTNPYFLDTQAYILYKQKKYSEAKHILAPIAQHTNNATILLHLAEIHYTLDNKEEANALTKKATSFVKGNHEKEALKRCIQH